MGFGAAGLGGTGKQEVSTGLRDCGRLITSDKQLAWQIFERIRTNLPRVWQGRHILGLNEQLKFLRYHPGQKFVPHMDGAYKRPGTTNRTFFTVQLYLSQEHLEGGATRFVGANPADEGVRCEALAGRCLVFKHDILHEVTELRWCLNCFLTVGCRESKSRVE